MILAVLGASAICLQLLLSIACRGYGRGVACTRRALPSPIAPPFFLVLLYLLPPREISVVKGGSDYLQDTMMVCTCCYSSHLPPLPPPRAHTVQSPPPQILHTHSSPPAPPVYTHTSHTPVPRPTHSNALPHPIPPNSNPLFPQLFKPPLSPLLPRV
jgi:hypothetical protein